jgi:hypothetical protein
MSLAAKNVIIMVVVTFVIMAAIALLLATENRDSTRPVETVVVIKPGSLTIPVVGVRPEQLRDTYSEPRAEGRTHNALDIIAKCDTQIVAATAGKIVKLFQSERGGVTIYQMAADNRTVYYYAHLARYAGGRALRAGRRGHRLCRRHGQRRSRRLPPAFCNLDRDRSETVLGWRKHQPLPATSPVALKRRFARRRRDRKWITQNSDQH